MTTIIARTSWEHNNLMKCSHLRSCNVLNSDFNHSINQWLLDCRKHPTSGRFWPDTTLGWLTESPHLAGWLNPLIWLADSTPNLAGWLHPSIWLAYCIPRSGWLTDPPHLAGRFWLAEWTPHLAGWLHPLIWLAGSGWPDTSCSLFTWGELTGEKCHLECSRVCRVE